MISFNQGVSTMIRSKITIPQIRELTELVIHNNETRVIGRTPKINYGPEFSDEFLRTSELYDPNIDSLHRGYTQYDIDDVPLCQSHVFGQYFDCRINEMTSRCIDTDIKINEDLEILSLLNKYASVAQGDVSEMVGLGKKLLQDGMPVETVINYFGKAKLRANDGTTKAAPGFMQFIIDHPNSRKYMVTYNHNRDEVFDEYGAKVFNDLCEMTKGDEKAANKLLWHCRVECEDDSFATDPDLFKLLKSSYEKTGKIDPRICELLEILKETQPSIKSAVDDKFEKQFKKYTRLLGKIQRAINKGDSETLDSIIVKETSEVK